MENTFRKKGLFTMCTFHLVYFLNISGMVNRVFVQYKVELLQLPSGEAI